MKDSIKYSFFLFIFLFSCLKNKTAEDKNLNYNFKYFDNFEEEAIAKLPSHWVQTFGHKSWIAGEENDNKFLTQRQLQEEKSQIFLHLFDRNPLYKGRFKIKEFGKNGRFSFLLRYNAEGAVIKITYDKEKQVFTLTEQEDIGRKVKSYPPFPMNLGKNWHDFHIKIADETLTFSIDGKPITVSGIKHQTFGRLGFETENCIVTIDDVVYGGDEGRPNDGVVEGEIRIKLDSLNMNSGGRPFWGLHLGVISHDEQHLTGIVGFRDHNSRADEEVPYPYCTISSRDGGLTWKGTEIENRKWMKSEDGTLIRGIWPNFTQQKDEIILMGYDEKTGKNTAFVSTDKGEKWTKRGTLNVTEELEEVYAGHPWQRFMMTMPGKLSQNKQGLFYPTTRVLWNSTDKGKNWNPIYVFHRGNKTWNPRSQEHQIIETEENTLEVYSRDDGARENLPESMTIVKRTSTDGGHSWSDYTLNNTSFVSSKCAFNIKKDPYQENTFWMFWTFNNKNDEPSVNNQPRTRLGLAVSHDNAQTWKYVMDVDDWGFPSYDTTAFDFNPKAKGKEKFEQENAYLQRDNRYANLSLWIGEKYLFLTVRRRFRHDKPKLEDYCIFYTRVEKSKIEPYAVFPKTRY